VTFRPVLSLGQLSDVDLTGANPGDVLELGGGGLWIPAVVSGGITPVDLAEQFFYNDPAFPNNVNTIVPWVVNGSPNATLLDLTSPTNPVVIDTGLYSFTLRMVCVAPNLYMQFAVPISPADDPMTVQAQDQHGGTVGEALVTGTFWLESGTALQLYLAQDGGVNSVTWVGYVQRIA
jgi:hypothetical protein